MAEISQQLKYELHKGFMTGSVRHTFVLMAIFFTSYEHLKNYVFKVNDIENSYGQAFRERFISAGIASSISYLISNNGLKAFKKMVCYH